MSDAIRLANQAFYDAFQNLDLAAMVPVWSHRESDACIHPGWPILVGWDKVHESFERIFENTSFMRFELIEVDIHDFGDVARVTCVENIYAVQGSQSLHSQVACTNLFERIEGDWRMVLHQGSPMSLTRAQDAEGEA
jgi:ketosteroid isomerase-like protein